MAARKAPLSGELRLSENLYFPHRRGQCPHRPTVKVRDYSKSLANTEHLQRGRCGHRPPAGLLFRQPEVPPTAVSAPWPLPACFWAASSGRIPAPAHWQSPVQRNPRHPSAPLPPQQRAAPARRREVYPSPAPAPPCPWAAEWFLPAG